MKKPVNKYGARVPEWSMTTPSKEPSVDEIFDPVTMDNLEIPQWWIDKTKSQLLALHLGCLPEKYHFVQYREFLVADKRMPLEANQKQAQSYVEGFSVAIDLMEQKLREMYET